MNGDEMIKGWHSLSEEVIKGMAEWRQQHPKATFREIEEEVDRRLARLRVRMMTDVAVESTQTEWKAGEQAAVCPRCGVELVQKGKKKRKLQTGGGQEVELEREYGVCPRCGQGIFPPG